MPARNIALTLLGLLALAAIAARSLAVALMVLLGAVIGPVVGLASSAAYFTASFKLGLAGGLLLAATLVALGWRHREHGWGQGVVVVGIVAWTLCGLVGFGPQ